MLGPNALSHSIRRVPMAVAFALSVLGCAGGWTGEITELGACREDVGPAELSQMSAALERSGRTGRAEVEWSLESFAVGVAELTVSVEERGPARLLGGEGCEAPLTTSPIRARVETSDGALRETLDGEATVVGTDAVLVRVSRPASELEGTGAPPEAEALHLEVTFAQGGVHGTVTFNSDAEEAAGAPLALF